jgi:hypothetical protein
MNTVTLTRAEFDALPEYHYPPKPVEVGTRWKRFYSGLWFVAEYIQAAPDVIGIEFWKVVLADGPSQE